MVGESNSWVAVVGRVCASRGPRVDFVVRNFWDTCTRVWVEILEILGFGVLYSRCKEGEKAVENQKR